MPGLRRQYRSWGLTIGALARKNEKRQYDSVPVEIVVYPYI